MSVKRLAAAVSAALIVSSGLVSYARAAAASPQLGPEVRAWSLAVSAPPGAVDEGRAGSSTSAELEVVLAPSDPTGIQAFLRRAYDPSSPDYHRWLTPSEFDHLFGPSAATVSAAESWLRSKGLDPRRASAFALTAHASAGALGRATGTTFHRYRTETGRTGLAAQGAPLVPASLRPAVTAIYGLSTLPRAAPSRQTAHPDVAAARPLAASAASTSVQACASATNEAGLVGGYTMNQLSAEYGISALQGAGLTGAGQTVGVYELSPYSASDWGEYQACFGLTNTVTRSDPTSDGPATDPSGTPEADLDIEQLATQAPGASIISYEAPNTDQGAYDLWAAIVNSDAAKVISTSWGYCEADAWGSSQTSTATSTLLAQAALQGQTVVAAAGDSGSEDCARDYPNPGWDSLGVDYPGSDPSVTAVGGTDFYSPGNETVWNDCAGASNQQLCAVVDGFQAAGGGGESLYEPRPSWQPAAAGAPPRTCGGTSCREVPDLSANAGIPEVDYDNGQWNAGLGTSYAAPLIAGLVADRNQGCTAPTGNFTPVLYSAASTAAGYAASFRDVTSGNNDMVGDQSGSYPAGAGYDLASGLGTPSAAGLACPDVVSVSAENASGQATITGVGLEEARVSFGGQPATVVASSATSATVDVPAGSGTVTVSASAGAWSGSVTASFSYPAAPSGPATPPAAATPTTTASSPTSTSTSTSGPTTTAAPTTTASQVCASSAGPALSGAAGIAAVSINGCDGYFVVDSAGQVSAFGGATSHGDLSGHRLSAPIIAIEATPDGGGYWLLGADGGVFAFGDARFYGSTGGIRLNAPVVGMAVTPDNQGYWIVAKDGGVFSFGDARFYGSTGNLELAAPVDGIAVAPGGHGYWLVAADGGVFTFTPDGFYGSLGGVRLAKPVVGMSSTPDGRGYTLVGSDGGVFTFGDAPFYGSLGGHPPAAAVVDLSPAPANDGYYLVTSAGSVYTFGPGTRYFGSV